MYRDGLSLVLMALDKQCSASFTGDDICDWEPGHHSALLQAGVLVEAGYTPSVVCDECGEACREDVAFAGGRDGEPARAYVICCHRDDMGRVEIPLDRLRAWSASADGLAAWLGRELGCRKVAEKIADGRLWSLGRLDVDDQRLDVCVARGGRWSDARSVFGQSAFLSQCLSVLVIVPVDWPQKHHFGEFARLSSMKGLLRIEDGQLLLDREELASAMHPVPQPSTSAQPFRHSSDFRSVLLRGTEYGLTTSQARVVEQLAKAHRNGTPDIGQEYLLEQVLETTLPRLRDVFQGSGAWNTLIIPGKTRGTYRLNV